MRSIRTKSPPHNRKVIESDHSVFIIAYTESGDVKVQFAEGGYIWPNTFRRVYKEAKDGKIFTDGAVRIVTRIIPPLVAMDVTIILTRDRGTVKKTLSVDTVDEIMERLNHVDTELRNTYNLDRELEEDAPPRDIGSGTRIIGHKGAAA